MNGKVACDRRKKSPDGARHPELLQCLLCGLTSCFVLNRRLSTKNSPHDGSHRLLRWSKACLRTCWLLNWRSEGPSHGEGAVRDLFGYDQVSLVVHFPQTAKQSRKAVVPEIVLHAGSSPMGRIGQVTFDPELCKKAAAQINSLSRLISLNVLTRISNVADERIR